MTRIFEILSLVAAVVVVTAATAGAQLTTLNHWRLGEGATAGTDGVGGLDLTATGSTTGGPGAVTGSTIAQDFVNGVNDGTGEDTATNFWDGDIAPTTPSNWGVEMWVNLDLLPNGTDQSEVGLVHIGGTGGGIAIELGQNPTFGDGSVGWAVHRTGVGLSLHNAATGVADPTIGTWTHLAYVNEGSTAIFYVDGVASNEVPAAGVTGTGAPDITIGSMWSNNRRGFDGQLDEVRIFTFESGTFDINDTFLTGVPEALDLPLSLVVERGTGATTLSSPANNSRVFDVKAYSILSGAGAIANGSWTPIEDANLNWLEIEHAPHEVAEGTLDAAESVTLASGASIDLGNLWLQSITEDFAVEVLLKDGSLITSAAGDIPVLFEGNGGDPFEVGDLDFDGDIGPSDWPVFRAAWLSDLSGLTAAEAYRMSDLDGDGDSDIHDFDTFRVAYEGAQGGGSFAAMLARTTVPEPSSAVLVALGGLALVLRRQRFSKKTGTTMRTANYYGLACGALLCPLLSTPLLYATTTAVHQYRLGEADSGSGVGLTGANPTIDSIGGINLGRNGSPDYVAGAPITGTTLSLDFANTYGPDGNGTAVDFYRDISFDLEPTDSGNWGLEAWVNFDTVPSLATDGQQEAGIVHAGTFAGGSLILQTIDSSGNTVFAAHAPGRSIFGGTTSIVADTWNHVAAVVNGGTMELYVNGALEGSAGVGGLNPAMGLTVGAVNFAGVAGLEEGRGLDGSMDEVRIFEFAAGEFNPATDLQLTQVILPPVPLKLNANTATGRVTLLNDTGGDIDISAYEMLSAAGSLDPLGWTSLEEQNLPFFPAGDGSGNGWEEAGGVSMSGLSEGFLLGNSTLSDGASISLGAAYDKGLDAKDLVLTYRLASGEILSGLVVYTDAVDDLVGDYNSNGQVEQGDLDLVLLNWGNDVPPVPEEWINDLPTSPKIDQDDLDRVLLNWGNTMANAQTVPEPMSWAILVPALIGLVGLGRRRGLGGHLAVIACIGVLFGSGTATADVTNDRFYQLGDDTLENASAGAIVGSGHSVPNAGDTLDSGEPGDPSGSFLDLAQTGGAVYVDVSTIGAGRPGTATDDLGVQFDGVDDLLHGVSLNRPDEMAGPTPIGAGPLVENYPFNYDTITARGAQLWVYPDASAVGVARQVVLMDTIAAGGIAITADGKWTQINDGHANDTDIPAIAPVVGDQWYHVMHHVYPSGHVGAPVVVPGTGAGDLGFTGVVYVDGLAVAANNDSPDPNDFASGDRVGVVSVGAEEVAGDGTNPSYGSYFQGVMDDLEMYVFGDNSSETGPPEGRDYGTFDLFDDNQWIVNAITDSPLLQGTLQGGDVDRDGDVDDDDVTDLISNWRRVNVLEGSHNDVIVGDWETWGWGDLNHDGTVNLLDWDILGNNHPSPASLDLAALLRGVAVPEPSAIGLVVIAGVIGLARRRRRR